MSDAPHTSRSLTEIGHLFLSSVRERQTNGAALPRRQPPERMSLSVPTPPQLDIAIEVAPVVPPPLNVTEMIDATPLVAEESLGFPPVTAILGAHLNGRQSNRVKDYARHLAARGQRIGLIELDSSELRLTCFDQLADGEQMVSTPVQRAGSSIDARSITDALEELNWDLDRWLVVLPNLRAAGARELLGEIGHWVLLSTCDHEGVVSCYRTLKVAQESQRPRLSLAVLDARDDREAQAVHHKLQSVCRQFLNWPLDSESRVMPAVDISEHVILQSGPNREMIANAVQPQWQAVADFLARAKVQSADAAGKDAAEESQTSGMGVSPVHSSAATQGPDAQATGLLDHSNDNDFEPEASTPMARPLTTEPTMESLPFPGVQPGLRWAGSDTAESTDSISEVIELPESHVPGGSILPAILRSESARLVECPVTPPMCPEARLAVTRDRRIVLLAAARQGLGDLRSIARAYNWLVENYKLICMAMPQMSIDPAVRPCLRLFIDHADLTAEILQPMLQSSTVTVQAYRRLRWGTKTGLLLDAA